MNRVNFITPHVVRFCARECKRQSVGPLSVADMVDAYQYAANCKLNIQLSITPEVVQKLGALVNGKTVLGYRQFPVTIDGIAIPFENIEANILTLCSLSYTEYNSQTAKEFYFYFERIHPFEDGNGRVGAILFNWINGTMSSPIDPPDHFPLIHPINL